MKLTKIFFSCLFLLGFVFFRGYCQEWGMEIDLANITFLNLGFGIGFDKNYNAIVPGGEAWFKAIGGYAMGEMNWYGAGDEYTIASGNETNDLLYNQFYVRTEFNQIIIGDRYSGSCYLDIGFSYIASFYIPFLNPFEDKGKSLFQANLITGDNNSIHNIPAMNIHFQVKDDDFRTTKGFEYFGDLGLEFGGEPGRENWFFLTSFHNIDAWAPVAKSYLFFHFNIEGNFVPARIIGKVPVYRYPCIDTRNIDHSFYDYNVLSAQIEIISRFLNFNIPHCPMSFGLGAFFDIGISGQNFSDYSKDTLSLSFGGFLENKLNFEYKISLPVTIHIGIMNQIQIVNNHGIFPGFYFSLII